MKDDWKVGDCFLWKNGVDDSFCRILEITDSKVKLEQLTTIKSRKNHWDDTPIDRHLFDGMNKVEMDKQEYKRIAVKYALKETIIRSI